jgi:hypothetical protein
MSVGELNLESMRITHTEDYLPEWAKIKENQIQNEHENGRAEVRSEESKDDSAGMPLVPLRHSKAIKLHGRSRERRTVSC